MSRTPDKNVSKRPALFSNKKGFNKSDYSERNIKLKDLADISNIFSTASFRYDSPGSGIKSTQQIPLDWSKFENHCFFDSAQSKINVAFDTIINQFPFDGTQKETEAFFDNLTGYENYIYQQFPKHRGYLIFSGTQKGEDPASGYSAGLGTRIDVFDSRGFIFPNLSRKRDGASSVEFLQNPFSVEFFINIPSQVNDNQVIIQKRSASKSTVSIALSQSNSTENCKILFSVLSGSSKIFASSSIEKGKFVHVSSIYDRELDGKAKLYLDSILSATSSNGIVFDNIDTSRAQLKIGSGSAFSVSSGDLPGPESVFAPRQTLSGSLDELRIFHSARDSEKIKNEMNKTIFNTEDNDLKLYFKFNEASGSYNPQNIALDSSGNSLHSLVQNFALPLRVTGSVKSPVINEKQSLCPILFPDHYLVKRLNQSLLESASRYDSANPNIITKLVPPHLFLEGQRQEGFKNLQGEVYNPITGKSIPGSAKLGSAQILTAFLLTYAKFFDELKIVLDSISNFLNINYDDVDVVPEQFLPLVARYYGIELPGLFSSSTIFEFIEGENIGDSPGYSPKSLRDLQNDLWKRFLINLPFIIRGKGTVESVKSTIRSFGINPDKLLNIREFGGPTRRSLESRRNTFVDPMSFVNMSGSILTTPGTENHNGFFSKIPHIISPFLSASRVEPGYPRVKGEFVNKSKSLRNGMSNEPSDGLLTSGSFSYEAFYRFLEPNRAGFRHPEKQSLVRMSLTGSSISKHPPIINLIAHSGSETTEGKLTLYVRSSLNTSEEGIRLVVSGANVFSGDPWYVSFGRLRSDDTITSVSQSFVSPPISTAGSSSYYLSCMRSVDGKIKESYTSFKFLRDEESVSSFENINASHNASGTFITIGSQSLGSYANLFLSDPSLDTSPGFQSGDREVATICDFTGEVSKIKFWSGGLTKDQRKEHALNPRSYGSENPLRSYDFTSMSTGSFERIRIDAQLDQPVSSSDALGEILLTNFTQEIGDLSGRSFEKDKNVFNRENFYVSKFSPKFDLAQEDNKVRVRSFERFKNFSDSLYAQPAPIHRIRPSEEPDDDNRFSIEFSSVKSLEEDIMSMFSSMIFFDNSLGRPDILFDEIYPDLEQAQKVYFRRLTGKPEFQDYFSMFKWFNSSLGDLIDQIVPRNTRFLGVDFVFESHPLERSRFRYLFDEIYLKSEERSFDRGDIFLSQYVGNICKF